MKCCCAMYCSTLSPPSMATKAQTITRESQVDEKDRHYSSAVLQAVDAGRKIDAIKLLREETGLGLKEAKQEIDHLAIIRRPQSATMPEQGGASAIVKIALVGLALFLLYRFLIAT